MKLVIFEKKENEPYVSVINSIKSISNYAKITDNCYMFDTNLSKTELRDMLSNSLTGRVFVLDFYTDETSWASYKLPNDVVDWLKKMW